MRKTTQKKIDAIKKLFDFIGFTEDEAYLLHSETFNWARQLRPPVNVDFGVIYRDKGFHTEILPYIDYKRLDEIWGVEVNGIKVSSNLDHCSWNKAVKTAQAKRCRLFTVKEVEHLVQNQQKIEDALYFLIEHLPSAQGMEIDADISWTLTADEINEKYAYQVCPAPFQTYKLAKREGAAVRYTL